MVSISSEPQPAHGVGSEGVKLEGTGAREVRCGSCGAPIATFYFTAGEALFCERCRLELAAPGSQGSGLGRLLRAGLFGGVVAGAGAGLWALVAQLTGYEIGLVAIVVGWAVGSAVHAGSGARGGLPYQLLAVCLTYAAIVSTYVPYVVESFRQLADEELSAAAGEREEQAGVQASLESTTPQPEVAPVSDSMVADSGGLVGQQPAPQAGDAPVDGVGELTQGQQIVAKALFALIVFGIAAAAPFLAGAENLVGILIIGIALWEAWRRTRRVELTFAGPFEVGKQAPA